jgi:hypothetical protein
MGRREFLPVSPFDYRIIWLNAIYRKSETVINSTCLQGWKAEHRPWQVGTSHLANFEATG